MNNNQSNALQKLSNCWGDRLDNVLQYLEPSDLIRMAFVQKSCLTNVQFFFKHIKKNCTTNFSIAFKKLDDGTPYCTMPNLVINNCLILITKIKYHSLFTKTVYQPIKKYHECHGFKLYGWIIEGRDMLLTGGKRRPYPEELSISTHRYLPTAFHIIPNSNNFRIVPYKVF